MEKLAVAPEFALQLPVWLITHPTKKSKGYITIAGQAGQNVMPLFTEEILAQRFRNGAPQLAQHIVGRAGDSDEITHVLNLMEGQGFTHAAIDPTTKRGILFDISQLRSVASQMAQNPEAGKAEAEAKDD